LDIAALIQTPRDSPFAKALQSATSMLVVPSHTGSIYSRIWCVYEAFLGYSQSKIIFTACSPVQHLARSVVGMLVVETAGVMFGLLVHPTAFTLFYVLLFALALFLVRLCLYPGAVAAVLIHLCGFSFGVVLAWVRDTWRQAILEKEELLRGYTGSLRDAQSSKPSDKEAILAELDASGHEEEVDMAVEVLIKSGMSTPTLRAASALAGPLQQAGYWNYCFVCVVSVVIGDFLVGLQEREGPALLLTCCLFLLCCLWLLIFVFLRPDRRGFASRVMFRLGFTCMFLEVVGHIIFHLGGGVSHQDFVPMRSVTIVAWMATITLSLAGPGVVAGLPLIGVPLVRYIMQANCL